MEQYWDCSLCRIEDKGNAFRCRSCAGKLKGRDRLLREVADAGRLRRVASALSSFAAGLGQTPAAAPPTVPAQDGQAAPLPAAAGTAPPAAAGGG